MPGTVGDYTIAELQEMPDEELKAAERRGFQRLPLEEDVRAALAAAPRPQPVPKPEPAPEPRDDVWASQAAGAEEDFVCPSGQRCRLQKLKPEQLMKSGLLKRVTRLEGLAAELVNRAEGQPPTPEQMPSAEDLEMLLQTINGVVALAVVRPTLYLDDDESAPENAIRVSQVGLEDRMAIMERSFRGLRLLDAFRNPR